MTNTPSVFVIVDNMGIPRVDSVHTTLDSAKGNIVSRLGVIDIPEYESDLIWYDWGREYVLLYDLKHHSRYRIYEVDLVTPP